MSDDVERVIRDLLVLMQYRGYGPVALIGVRDGLPEVWSQRPLSVPGLCEMVLAAYEAPEDATIQ